MEGVFRDHHHDRLAVAEAVVEVIVEAAAIGSYILDLEIFCCSDDLL